jgi:hypothetical protein
MSGPYNKENWGGEEKGLLLKGQQAALSGIISGNLFCNNVIWVW